MKVGIVGAGKIAPEFLEAASLIKEYEIQSICATENGREKMNELSKQYGIKKIFTNYDEFLNDDFDVVYIAIPNNLHYEFAKKAIEKNKHIILEKPFTTKYKDALDLVELAKENNIIIFEAITNQYYPNYKKTKELINQLGDIKIVQLNYSQYSSRYDKFKQGIIEPAFDVTKGGGALFDLGVYNIHFVLGLFGKPTKAYYTCNVEKGVDTSGVLLLEYPTFKCVSIAAKDCAAPVSINIQGDKGYINSTSAANVYNKFTFKLNNENEEKYELNGDKHRFYHELLEFSELYKKDDLEKFQEYNEHTLNVMEVLEMARRNME